MVEQVKPGVVRIETSTGNGTGFIFETTGQTALVLTNHHVIDDANRIQVVVNDAQRYRATVRGYDAYRDLAVLEICCGDFQALDFHDSQNVKSGSEVIAIGYALGITGSATVTRGIISAVRYDTEYKSWVLQTDAPINPGNSGGPLLLPTGEIIGINTFVYREDDAEGLGFAIAQSSIMAALPDLKRGTQIAFPTPTALPLQWRTYTNREYGYTIKVPADWEIDDSDKSEVIFDSPDGFAGIYLYVYDWRVESVGDWVDETIEYLKEFYKSLFQVIERETIENADGTGSAYVIARGGISAAYCVQRHIEVFGVAYSKSYSLTFWMCEHSISKYDPVGGPVIESFAIQ